MCIFLINFTPVFRLLNLYLTGHRNENFWFHLKLFSVISLIYKYFKTTSNTIKLTFSGGGSVREKLSKRYEIIIICVNIIKFNLLPHMKCGSVFM